MCVIPDLVEPCFILIRGLIYIELIHRLVGRDHREGINVRLLRGFQVFKHARAGHGHYTEGTSQHNVKEESSFEVHRGFVFVSVLRVQYAKRHNRLQTPSGLAIRLIGEFGVETPDGLIKAQKSTFKTTTVNRYLRQWGYDHETLRRQPAAVRFQAEHSNDCWQFDLSPSDLKEIKEPLWLQPSKGAPTLMLFGVVDDRSGVAYQEYRCVYGEDVEAALRFLFNAMAPKQIDGFLFQGIPKMIYLDNGPVARSHVFQQVMGYLDIDVRAHLPQGKDGRRVTARSKGKVERPFRSVKEMHETLYHFHEPKDEEEANAWLMNFLVRYNAMEHRSEPHSRMEDWLENLPASGVRAVCSWERFCTFAREPERRKVGGDARVSVAGVNYEVDPDLAGETVILWWGIFDNELYVEHGDKRFGPYAPVGGPIPLYRYRTFKKSPTQQRADRIEALAEQLALPRAALEGNPRAASLIRNTEVSVTMFMDPDPFQEFAYPNVLAAKRAIADYLAIPLAKLPPEQLEWINTLVDTTLSKKEVIEQVEDYFGRRTERESPC
jgi:hypothetical protein